MAKSIFSELDRLMDESKSSIQLADGLTFNQAELIKQITYYINSRYEKGDYDEYGRPKPFYNIVNANKDVSVSATDLDTKDIQITTDKPQDYARSFLMTREVYQWMKEADFARFLNQLNDTRATYGGAVVKRTECKEKGKKKLKAEVVPWANLATNPVSIMDNPIVEKHYMGPLELAEKRDVWEKVDEAIELAAKSKGEKQDGAEVPQRKITVYEIHGAFSVATYKLSVGETPSASDEYDFRLYQFFVTNIRNGKYVLYAEEVDEMPYMYFVWNPVPCRALGRGVIEAGVEAQIWTNDVVMKQRRALEVTSKVIGQSASKNLKGKNLRTEIDDGEIIEHDPNAPITTLQLVPSGGFGQFDNLIQQWNTQFERATATYEAARGETPPSGTPFRTQALAVQQVNTQFSYRREEMAISLTELLEDWVLPYLAKQINKAHILAQDFSAQELSAIDEAFAKHQAHKAVIEKVLAGEVVSEEDYQSILEETKQSLSGTKTTRFIEVPDNYFKDLEANVSITITGEQRDKAATLESLSNILNLVASNPAVLQDPVMSQIFGQIVELSGAGISPVSLGLGTKQQMNQSEAAAQMQAAQPQSVPQDLSLMSNPQ